MLHSKKPKHWKLRFYSWMTIMKILMFVVFFPAVKQCQKLNAFLVFSGMFTHRNILSSALFCVVSEYTFTVALLIPLLLCETTNTRAQKIPLLWSCFYQLVEVLLYLTFHCEYEDFILNTLCHIYYLLRSNNSKVEIKKNKAKFLKFTAWSTVK